MLAFSVSGKHWCSGSVVFVRVTSFAMVCERISADIFPCLLGIQRPMTNFDSTSTQFSVIILFRPFLLCFLLFEPFHTLPSRTAMSDMSYFAHQCLSMSPTVLILHNVYLMFSSRWSTRLIHTLTDFLTVQHRNFMLSAKVVAACLSQGDLVQTFYGCASIKKASYVTYI